MPTEEMQSAEAAALAKAEGRQVVNQIADLVTEVLGRPVMVSPDDETFVTSKDITEPGGGIVSLRAKRQDDRIRLGIELVRTTEPLPLKPEAWAKIAALGKLRAYPLEPEAGQPGSYWVCIDVLARRLPYERQQMLSGAIKACQDAAITLQRDLPASRLEEIALGAEFEPVAEHVQPVRPWSAPEGSAAKLRDWASETNDYLRGRLTQAAIAPDSISENIGQALLAEAARKDGFVLVRTRMPVTARAIVEIAEKLPPHGVLVVPARSITLTTNRYDLAAETAVMFDFLRARQRPVVFFGDHSQLQRALGGGPGGRSDALHPICSPIPEIPLRVAVRHEVETIARRARVPARFIDPATDQVVTALARADAPDPLAIASATANWVLAKMSRSERDISAKATRIFVGKLVAKRTTLGGLVAQQSLERPNRLEKFYQRLAAPELRGFLEHRIFGQRRALGEITSHIRREVRHRPRHQPPRALLVGSPGVGKSRLCELIAEYAGVEYRHLNLGGMADETSVIAELKGAPPGYVGSDKPGFFEMAAKTAHDAGLVLEIADLDHASFAVRQAVTSLLLGPLDAGFFQVAAGVQIQCAGMFIVLTTNLPGNADERLATAPGFIGPTSADVRDRVIEALKDATGNNAVLSRLGSPIVLDPLPTTALRDIIENEIKEALERALARAGIGVRAEVVSGTGAALLKRHRPRGLLTMGARGVQELARSLADPAIDDFLAQAPPRKHQRLLVRALADAEGKLIITVVQTLRRQKE
jgi:hypothetical protein